MAGILTDTLGGFLGSDVCASLTLGGEASGFDLILSNIPASWSSVAICSSKSGARGVAGDGFCRAAVSCCAATASASSEEVLGISTSVVYHVRVSAMHSLRVYLVHTL